RRKLFRERRDRAAQLDGVHGHREVQLESRRAQGVAVVVRARQRERRNVAAALRRWPDLRTTTKWIARRRLRDAAPRSPPPSPPRRSSPAPAPARRARRSRAAPRTAAPWTRA